MKPMGHKMLKIALRDKLTTEDLEHISKSFDIVGNIAVVRVSPQLKHKKAIVAEMLMKIHRNVKTVLNQIGPVKNDFRLRKLEWVLGENKMKTIHRESGCLYKVDLAEVYFSPRLSYERMRIAKLVKKGEVVLNMFAGVGCFSIMIAKKSEVSKVYSIDLNPKAVQLMRENISLNKVEGRVEALMGDAWKVIETNFRGKVDRVLMPLPPKAFEYLDIALIALRPKGGIIHYYDVIHVKKRKKAEKEIIKKIKEKMNLMHIRFEVISSKVVRSVGPNWFQVVLDLKISL